MPELSDPLNQCDKQKKVLSATQFPEEKIRKNNKIKMTDFLGNVFIAGLAHKRKCEKEDIGASITQWPQSVVILLAYNTIQTNTF